MVPKTPAQLQGASSEGIDGSRPARETGLKQKYSSKGGSITTLMLRNIPSKYTQDMLMEEVIECVTSALGLAARLQADCLDFFYMPWDQQHDCNVGYAFVNFCTTAAAEACVRSLSNFHFKHSSNTRPCTVYPAHVQGLENNILHLMDRAVSEARSHYPIIMWKGEKVKLGKVISALEKQETSLVGPVSAPGRCLSHRALSALASQGGDSSLPMKGTGCSVVNERDDLFEPEVPEREAAYFEPEKSALNAEISLLEAMPNLKKALQKQPQHKTSSSLGLDAPRSMPTPWQFSSSGPLQHASVACAALQPEMSSNGPASLRGGAGFPLAAPLSVSKEAPMLPPPSGHGPLSMRTCIAPPSSTGPMSLKAFTAAQLEAPSSLLMDMPTLPPPAGFEPPQLRASSTATASLRACIAPELEVKAASLPSHKIINPMGEMTLNTIKVRNPDEDVVSRFFERFGT